jgi:hypothetical protein
VHGSVRNGDAAWAAQKPLASRFETSRPQQAILPPNRWRSAAASSRSTPQRWLPSRAHWRASSRPPSAWHAARPRSTTSCRISGDNWEDGLADPREFLLGFYRNLAGREVELPDPLPPRYACVDGRAFPVGGRPAARSALCRAVPEAGRVGRLEPRVRCRLRHARGTVRRRASGRVGRRPQPQLAEGFNERLLEFLTSSGDRSRP